MKRQNRLIGEIIRRYRLKAGLSQMRLAELLGVTYQQIQKYESGKSGISVERLLQIADALSVPVTRFFPSEKEVISEWEEPYGELTTEEKRLVELFRKLGKRSRKALLELLEEINKK
jgi:transcriptional regulator with XRE-family HTH domain